MTDWYQNCPRQGRVKRDNGWPRHPGSLRSRRTFRWKRAIAGSGRDCTVTFWWRRSLIGQQTNLLDINTLEGIKREGGRHPEREEKAVNCNNPSSLFRLVVRSDFNWQLDFSPVPATRAKEEKNGEEDIGTILGREILRTSCLLSSSISTGDWQVAFFQFSPQFWNGAKGCKPAQGG